MIFYEAPHKLTSTLEDLKAAFGAERRIALCRELTKLHEQVQRMTLGEACAYYAEQPPRGEFVLVVEGAVRQEEKPTLEAALERVQELLAQGASKKDAVKQASQETGFPKNALYDAAMK